MIDAITETHRAKALMPDFDMPALAACHVHFDQLSGRPTLEKVIYDALCGPPPARWELCGPDGASKSSTISRLIHDVTRRKDSNHEVLMLEVGNPEVLESHAAFSAHVIATIQAQAHRFASPVQEQIKLSGADEITVEEPKRSHTSKLGVGVGATQAGYGYNLTERFRKLHWGQSATRAKHDLKEIVASLHAAERRPVVVVDDTEKFALTEDGEIDRDALHGLAAHAIPLLGDLGVDVLVATHPRFSDSPAMNRARQRWLTCREIPTLSVDDVLKPPLATIVDKHLKARDVKATTGDIFESVVLHQLQSTYLTSERNLRTVLRTAQRAVDHAHRSKAALVGSRELYAAQMPD